MNDGSKDRALAYWTDPKRFQYNHDFHYETLPVEPLVNAAVVGAIVVLGGVFF